MRRRRSGRLAPCGTLHTPGDEGNHRRERLFERIESLLRAVGIPRSLAEAGISQTEYRGAREELTYPAFTDPGLRTNPRIP